MDTSEFVGGGFGACQEILDDGHGFAVGADADGAHERLGEFAGPLAHANLGAGVNFVLDGELVVGVQGDQLRDAGDGLDEVFHRARASVEIELKLGELFSVRGGETFDAVEFVELFFVVVEATIELVLRRGEASDDGGEGAGFADGDDGCAATFAA